MKKVLAILLTVMTLMLLVSSVLAETEDEILFRSIPWGSTYQVTISALDGLGITWDSPVPYKTGTKDLETGFTVTSKRVSNFTVAGNNVSSVTLWFAYSLETPNSKDSALFIQAKYTFATGSKETGTRIEEDIKDKLSSVYLTPDDSKSSSIANDFTHYWYWYGANESKVTLYHDYTEPFFIVALAEDTLELKYTSGQMTSLLDTYYNYVNQQNNRNTDGL